MKCNKNCKEIVHFISPEFSYLFSHAVINMPNGTEKRISISQPTKYHCESKNSSECGCYFPSPPVGIDTKYDEKLGCLIDHLYEVPVEVVYNSTYTGVDKNDQYYKDIDNITKLAERIKKGEQP